MNALVTVVTYLAVGGLGGLIGQRFKFPASTLLGACFAVVIFNTLWKNHAELPKGYVPVIQVLVGIMIGASFSLDMFKNIHHIFAVVVGNSLVLILAGLLLSIAFSRLGWLDPATALVATSPGGMSGLVPLAPDVGANIGLVFVCHFVRIILALVSAPILIKVLGNWMKLG